MGPGGWNMRRQKPSAAHGPDVTSPAPGVPRPERRLATEGLRSFFASRTVGYLCLDESGRLTMANLTFLRWLGVRYESVIGRRRFGELLAEAYRPAFEAAFPVLREQGWLRDFRTALDAPRNGEPGHPILVHVTAIQDGNGCFLRYDAVVLDDRERVAAERVLFADAAAGVAPPPPRLMGGAGPPDAPGGRAGMLRSSGEERYQAVVAALSEGVVLQRGDGVILAWNPSAERILGMSAEEAIGHVVLDERWQAVREDHSHFPAEICPFRPGGHLNQACRNVTMGLRRPDGSHCWISLNTTPLFRAGETEPYGVVASFSDITASRRALQRLAFTQYAVDHANEGIARVGEDGRFRYVNEAACRLLGYSRDELLALRVSDVDVELPNGEWRRHWQRMLRTGSRIKESRVRRKDGSQVPVELAIGVMAPFGRTYHFTTLRDLSERKRNETALAESEERYRSVVTTIREGIVVQQADGTFIACNPSAVRILGIAEDALLGMHCSRLNAIREGGTAYPEDARPSQVALRSGQPCTEEAMGIRRPDGRDIWVSVHSVPLCRPGENHVHGVVSSFTDITQKRSLEKNLRFTQFAVDHAAEGIVWIDEAARFTYVNDEACRMLGYSRAELLAMKAYDIDETLTEASWSMRWQQLRPGGTFIMDTRLLARDGRQVPVELAITVQEMDGRQYHCDFMRDLTERTRAEAALRESEGRLRESSRRLAAVEEQERRRLAAELHDRVGSSLGVLALYLKDLSERLSVEAPDKLAQVVDDARAVLTDAVAAMRSITSDLRPSRLDYASLPDALADYGRQFQARCGIPVELRVEVEGGWRGLPEEDIALFRITQEALHNCTKHAGARHVTLELRAAPGHAVLSITDDGIGFDPAGAKDQGQPWGQGLLSMRERAMAIGWSFELQSAAGEGTRIKVSRTS